LKPHIYNDYATMRRLVPEMIDEDDDVESDLVADAYLPPAGMLRFAHGFFLLLRKLTIYQ